MAVTLLINSLQAEQSMAVIVRSVQDRSTPTETTPRAAQGSGDEDAVGFSDGGSGGGGLPDTAVHAGVCAGVRRGRRVRIRTRSESWHHGSTSATQGCPEIVQGKLAPPPSPAADTVTAATTNNATSMTVMMVGECENLRAAIDSATTGRASTLCGLIATTCGCAEKSTEVGWHAVRAEWRWRWAMEHEGGERE